MVIRNRNKLFLLISSVVIFLLIGRWYTISERSWHRINIEPGTELFAIEQNEIRRFVYENAALILIATRKNNRGSDFQNAGISKRGLSLCSAS